ncbi:MULTISPECIES: hypothetical protein [unclassified Wolbachia]|uniref:hypothetical protein n=1 Tax=unclassified Wolbachia TaxID=2640676 RepID=UPI0003024FA8|nr:MULTISPECIES: hypothetical protein [unclassified Wolbachia]
MFLLIAYIAELTSATATIANIPIPSGVAAKAASGASVQVEDTQYGAESATAAPMTYKEVSATSAVFVLWN